MYLEDPTEKHIKCRQQDLSAVREVGIEGWVGHPDLLGNTMKRRGLDTILGYKLQRHLDDLLLSDLARKAVSLVWLAGGLPLLHDISIADDHGRAVDTLQFGKYWSLRQQRPLAGGRRSKDAPRVAGSR